MGPQLMDAAGHGEVKEVQRLLELDPTIATFATEEGETPLHVACISGKPEIIRAIVAAGGKVDARAYGPNSLKMTPLSWCVFGGFKEAVVVLVLEAEADVNAVFLDERGASITVMDVCNKIGKDRDDIADVLKKRGGVPASAIDRDEM